MKRKLVIALTTERRIRQCERDTNPFEIVLASEDDALFYGQAWTMFWKDDIVMLVDVTD